MNSENIMLNRGNFLKTSLAGIFDIATTDVIANDNGLCVKTPNSDLKKEDIYCEFLAEMYISGEPSGTARVLGPFTDENGIVWFSALPDGFIYTPSMKKKCWIKLPLNVRRINTNIYDVYSRKVLISQLKEYFLKERIWEKFDL